MITATEPASAAVTEAVLALTALSTAFAVKHVLADFFLQTGWMARGKERRRGWLSPLLAHVLCHAALTLAVVLSVAPRLWWLALVDFGVHISVDRAKALATLRGAWGIDQPQFWWLLGFDQFLHQVTNVALATALVLL